MRAAARSPTVSKVLSEDTRLTSFCKSAIEFLLKEAHTCLYLVLSKKTSDKCS